MIAPRPILLLVAGLALILVGAAGMFWSALGIALSDGPGLITARLMLGASVLALAGGIFLSAKSAMTISRLL